MMTRDSLLTSLDRSVAQITDFLVQIDENFYDGHQTAREVLSHLVFWHREYVLITDAMVNGRSPNLRQSTFVALHGRAAREFRRVPLAKLCQDFCGLQRAFSDNLRKLPDWTIEFPVKKGCRRTTVFERIRLIQDHIDGHFTRLESAHRHGEAWVAAYFPSQRETHIQN